MSFKIADRLYFAMWCTGLLLWLTGVAIQLRTGTFPVALWRVFFGVWFLIVIYVAVRLLILNRHRIRIVGRRRANGAGGDR